MNMSLVLRVARDMHLCRSSSNVPRLPSFLEMPQNPHVLLIFDQMHHPVRLPRETTSERQKVHFFDISTSKSGPKLVCFLHLASECASRHNGVHFFDI